MTPEYDEIMHEAEKAYKYQESVENPYAFHDAFRFAQRKLGLLAPEEANIRALQIAEKAVEAERNVPYAHQPERTYQAAVCGRILYRIKTEIGGE